MRHFVRPFLLLSLLLLSLAGVAAERTTYYIPDAQGSPVAAMDEQGDVLWRESYAPYGERRVRHATNDAGNAYTGKPEDRDTGLVYMGARWYDPETARFTGIDPQGLKEGDPQSFGRYSYAGNSPYRYVDPNGESPVDVVFLAYDSVKFAAAMQTGNPAAIQSAGADLAASAVGLISPVPGVGQAIKAARAADRIAGGTRTAFRAIDPKYADATAKNGFHVSGTAGRLGNDGVYANSTMQGAIAEFKHHRPDVEPAVFEVNFPAGSTLKIDHPRWIF